MRFVGLILLVATASARADLSAKTDVSRYQGDRRVSTIHVAGSQIEGSWGEAFIDFAQFVYHVRQALDGSPVDGYEAYQEFNQFLDAASDKAAAEEGFVTYYQGTLANHLILTFKVDSDDDPIGTLKAVTPRSMSRTSISGIGSKHGKADVHLYPEGVAPGQYPVVFYTKETDCNLCLSIVHTAFVKVKPKPETCGPLPLACRAPTQEVDNLETAIRTAYDRKQQILSSSGSSAATHRAMEFIKGRMRICLKASGGREPQYSDCESRIPDMEGLCSRNAFGVSSDSLCRNLAMANDQIANLQARLKTVSAILGSMDCCHGGGVGPGPLPFPRPVILVPPRVN